MLSEADQLLLSAARGAQVNRNTAIFVFESCNAEASTLLAGSLVRVLLELPASHDEDYALARIVGTVEGAPYRGFSTNSEQETTTYLLLSLPRQLAELNGEQFQLNSVSNSSLNELEFSRWLEMMRSDGAALPGVAELRSIADRIRPLDASRRARADSRVHRGNGPAGVLAAPRERAGPPRTYDNISNSSSGLTANPAAASGLLPRIGSTVTSTNFATNNAGRNPFTDGPRQSQQQQQRQLARHPTSLARVYDANEETADGGATASPPVAGVVPLQSSSAPAGLHVTKEDEDERRLRQDIMNNLQTSATVFPMDCSGYKLSQLRTIERDMIEFMQHVRDEIGSKQENCVACMEHVPTVIMLPCRHKVLCRLCASMQKICPVCRSPIKEMFEAQEI